MGLTKDDLKRIKNHLENNIVLEKEEKIEIHRNLTGVSKTKTTFIRERFYQTRKKSRGEGYQEKSGRKLFPTQDLIRYLQHSLEEKDQQQLFEQRFENLTDQLRNLEKNINKEIEKLHDKRNRLIKSCTMSTKKTKVNAKYQTNRNAETWANYLSDNTKHDLLKTIRERIPECFRSSAFFVDGRHTSRIHTRNAASQVTPRIRNRDRGALGDYNHILCSKIKTTSKDRAVITKNCHASITTCRRQHVNGVCCHHYEDQTINACGNRKCFCFPDIHKCAYKCCDPQDAAPCTSHKIRHCSTLKTSGFVDGSTPVSGFTKVIAEINNSKTKETLSKRTSSHQRKKRESGKFEDEMKKRHTRQLKESMANIEKKISKYLNIYIAGRAKEPMLQEYGIFQNSDISAATAVNQNNLYQDFAENMELIESYDKNLPPETLAMLRKMTIREYKPYKIKDKLDGNKEKLEAMRREEYTRQEKEKNYQKNLEKYAKETETKEIAAIKALAKRESDKASMYKLQSVGSTRNLALADRTSTDEKSPFANHITTEAFNIGELKDTNSFTYVEEPSNEYKVYDETAAEISLATDFLEQERPQFKSNLESIVLTKERYEDETCQETESIISSQCYQMRSYSMIKNKPPKQIAQVSVQDLQKEDKEEINRTKFKAYPFKQESKPNVIEKTKMYRPEEFDSFNYMTFKQATNHNLGLLAKRSSQSNGENCEIHEKVSKQTFTIEIDSDQISQRSDTIEVAFKYTDNSANHHGDSEVDFGTANDLKSNLISCNSLLTNPEPIPKVDFREVANTEDDKSISAVEERSLQCVQYKEPKSAADSSDHEFRQQTMEKANVSVLTETGENKTQIENKERQQTAIISGESIENQLETIEFVKEIDAQYAPKELSDQRSLHLCTESANQQSLEILVGYQECKQNPSPFASLSKFVQEPTPQNVLNSIQEPSDELYIEDQYISRDLSSKNLQPVFENDLMVLRGNSKPRPIMEPPTEKSGILDTARTSKLAPNYKNIGALAVCSNSCNPGQENLAQAMYSIGRQCDDNATEINTLEQLNCTDCHLQAESVFENISSNNSSAPHVEEIPPFTQCPCMLETYLHLLTVFYDGEPK